MSRRLTLVAAGAILALAWPALLPSQEPQPLPFAPGETLTYDVSWSVFHAGQVVAKVESGGRNPAREFVVKTTADSSGFVSILYKVQDTYQSKFDPLSLCSRGISKTINEGHRHKVTEIAFDSTQRLALLNERDLNKPSDPPSHKSSPIPACAEDIVSAFYYLRGQPMRVGQKMSLAVNDGSKTADVIADVQAREAVQTPLGTFQAFRVEPTVFGNLFKRKGRMLIWFSDDRRRLPLRIKAMISVGAITGTLTSATGAPAAGQPGR